MTEVGSVILPVIAVSTEVLFEDCVDPFSLSLSFRLYPVLRFWSILSAVVISFQKLTVNREFRSEMISFGRPCRRNTCVITSFAKVVEIWQGTKCVIFVRRFMTTQIAS